MSLNLRLAAYTRLAILLRMNPFPQIRPVGLLGLWLSVWGLSVQAVERPNILILFTDDQRWDALHCAGNDKISTPNLDSIAARGTLFKNAFVTLSICSPSRAAMLTARYNSANGVTVVGKGTMNPGEVTFAQRLKEHGYRTGVTGKWHLGNTPADCGFDFSSVCLSNQTWYGRTFHRNGEKVTTEGFVDDFVVSESIDFIEEASAKGDPFVLWLCTQVPHMDHHQAWPPLPEFLDRYHRQSMPLTHTWNDNLNGKPPYLKESRSRTQALSYGYDDPDAIREHTRQYYASVEQMDASIGRLLDVLDRLKLRDNTWILFMGDNGWMMGDHGFTSKVLAYEESIRVPMMVTGPGTKARTDEHLVLGIDFSATVLDLAGIGRPAEIHGRSLLPLVRPSSDVTDWRTDFLYEAPDPQLGSKPLWAVRDDRWKYIETITETDAGETFVELYDLQNDPQEMRNLAQEPDQKDRLDAVDRRLQALKDEL